MYQYHPSLILPGQVGTYLCGAPSRTPLQGYTLKLARRCWTRLAVANAQAYNYSVLQHRPKVSAFLIGFNAIKNLFTLQENQKVSFSKKPTYHKESKLSSFYISFQVPEAVSVIGLEHLTLK